MENVTLSLSLWLPVGRANFYSVKSDASLLKGVDATGMLRCRSDKLDAAAHIPHLRASVMRRVLEVLPTSFGYEQIGRYELSSEPNEPDRPVSVTVTLKAAAASVPHLPAPAVSAPGAAAVPAGAGRRTVADPTLAAARIEQVEVRVDEHGFYTFTASSPADTGDGSRRVALAALEEHAHRVFGGNFDVHRRTPEGKRTPSEGAAAVRRYNGLAEDGVTAAAPPEGTLIFFQFNILLEGLCNESLLPAVFFEHYGFVEDWYESRKGSRSVLRTIRELVDELLIEADAATLAGQIAVLHHFLSVTARTSLQKLKWSMESVRRSLLDQMMAVLHRQAKLVQLDLGAIKYERSPELAVDATESQMRGYVMLVATKLPLVHNVGDAANLTFEHIRDQYHASTHPSAQSPSASRHTPFHDLERQLRHWRTLLAGLDTNVRSLRDAVERDWQERLLYEQEQARSEQEAMAEIERSRRGRPEGRRTADTAYNAMMLILTAVTVLFAVATANVPDPGTRLNWWQLALQLWPVFVVGAVFYLVVPGAGALRRAVRDRSGSSDSYSYEFAFRLNEATTPERVARYLSPAPRRRRRERRRGAVTAPSTGRQGDRPPPRIRIRRLGGGRIERVSADTTLVKLHSTVTLPVTLLRYARFEIVNEIMVRRVSENHQYFLRQIRVFGDSPKPLPPAELVRLVREILTRMGNQLAADGDIGVEELIQQANSVYLGQVIVPAPPADGAPASPPLPGQRRGPGAVAHGTGIRR